jgi:myosin heavy subunit
MEQKSLYDRIGLEPHVYEVSSLAYRGLATEGQDQTILVTGESGAGKTETVKIVMSYLANVQQTRPEGVPYDHSAAQDIVNRVCTSSPVFEAFGNARTIRNDNSSRFGKFSRLQFSLEPKTVAKQGGRAVPYTDLVGSSCTTYLLEKSRVVSHDLGERNYHIFYQLLTAPRTFKETLWPSFADRFAPDFAYLEGGGPEDETLPSDAEVWQQTEEALKVFQFEGESLQELMRALGIVLQLGNLVFDRHPSDESQTVIKSVYQLDALSKMTGLSGQELEATMTSRILKTRGHDDIVVRLTPQVAKESCDALAKEIYGRIFDLIVRRINEYTEVPSLQTRGNFGTISLLDIFGFECFQKNRFEQLCINYANEQLHNKYVVDNFDQVKDEYEQEGIDLYDFALVDNSEVLELLEGRNGLITSLNEECLRPKGNGESYVYKAKLVHQLSNRLISRKLHRKAEFGIVHFAGPVTYAADKFVERNMDKLPDNLVECARRMTNSVIRGEFDSLKATQKADPEEDNISSKKKRSHPTVLEKFKTQLKSLISAMEGTKTRYIRCIKPNTHMIPRRTDHHITMRQLECSGLMTAIAISKESFPNKLRYEFILDRYSCLVQEKHRGALQALDDPQEKVEFLLSRWLKSLSKKNRDGTRAMPFACGKTMVYFKAGAQERLEVLRIGYFHKAAAAIQALARKTIAMRQLSRARSSACTLQRFAFLVIDRAAFQRKRRAATRLASWVRGRLAIALRMELRKVRAATTIQSYYRALPLARDFKRCRKGSVTIQRSYRMYKKRNSFTDKLVALVEEKEMDIKILGLQCQLKEGQRKAPDNLVLFTDIEE